MADWVFRIQEPGQPPREVPVTAGLTLGSHADSGCRLADASVASRQGQIVLVGNSLLFEGTDGTCATRIEGGPDVRRGEQVLLRPGVRLVLGETALDVSDGSEPTPAATERSAAAAASDPSDPSQWIFRVQEPGQPSRQLPAMPGLTFGSHSDSGCALADDSVAAHHGQVVVVGGTLLFEVTDGEAGTAIEGGPTLRAREQVALRPGLQLLLGRSRVELHGGPVEDLPAAAPEPAAPARAEPESKQPVTAGAAGALAGAAGVTASPSDSSSAAALGAAAVVASTAPGASGASGGEPPAKPEAPAAEPAAEPKTRDQPAPETPAKAPQTKAEEPGEEKVVAEEKPAAPAQEAEAGEPVAEPVPAEATSQAAEDDDGGTLPGVDAPMNDLAKEGAFRAARPRLVVAHDTLGGIVDVDSLAFTIGRSKRRKPSCVLEHEGISGMHAEISFTGRRFFLEDLKSTNGTFIGEEMLAAKSRREIRADTRVRFGPVDALFVCDVDPEGRDIPKERYDRALDLLVKQSKITALQRSKAEEEARQQNRHPGEMLIAANLLSPAAWVEALEQAKILGLVGRQESAASRGVLVAVVAVLALVAAGVALYVTLVA